MSDLGTSNRAGEHAAMEMQASIGKPKASVRWPFRILAALIVLVGVLAMAGVMLVGPPHEQRSVKWQFVASLPGMLWLVHQAWWAALKGRSATHSSWPFASERVLACYVAVLMVEYFF